MVCIPFGGNVRPGRPPIDGEKRRVKVSATLSPDTLEYLRQSGLSLGQAIDAAVRAAKRGQKR